MIINIDMNTSVTLLINFSLMILQPSNYPELFFVGLRFGTPLLLDVYSVVIIISNCVDLKNLCDISHILNPQLLILEWIGDFPANVKL